MDADIDHGGLERVVLFCMDHHTVQAIIVQDPVVDPFGCRALVIYFFVSIRARNRLRTPAFIVNYCLLSSLQLNEIKDILSFHYTIVGRNHSENLSWYIQQHGTKNIKWHK